MYAGSILDAQRGEAAKVREVCDVMRIAALIRDLLRAREGLKVVDALPLGVR